MKTRVGEVKCKGWGKEETTSADVRTVWVR
jgi:hypothetical protein